MTTTVYIRLEIDCLKCKKIYTQSTITNKENTQKIHSVHSTKYLICSNSTFIVGNLNSINQYKRQICVGDFNKQYYLNRNKVGY